MWVGNQKSQYRLLNSGKIFLKVKCNRENLYLNGRQSPQHNKSVRENFHWSPGVKETTWTHRWD